jgi:TPP-dependent pyruvate/acetoin dehydrogenase alpha subunit
MTHTSDSLKAFEARVAAAFNNAEIRAPIHLHGNNEDQLLDYFRNVNDQDWVFSSWRSHYHCLLKGVPEQTLFRDILEGKSITLLYPSFNIYTSAIVGGIVPIALGTALGLKLRGDSGKVHLFMGGMTSETGAAYEAHKYAVAHDLPIEFILEINHKSVCTDTLQCWGLGDYSLKNLPKVTYYEYDLPWPHAGAGKRVQF